MRPAEDDVEAVLAGMLNVTRPSATAAVLQKGERMRGRRPTTINCST